MANRVTVHGVATKVASNVAKIRGSASAMLTHVVFSAGLLLASTLHAEPKQSIDSRLAQLRETLHCGAGPAHHSQSPACLVAMYWHEATADSLPLGDTSLVGATIEFPDRREPTWQAKSIPAVAGFRSTKTVGKACAMDMYADTPEQRAGILSVQSTLETNLGVLAGSVVVPSVVAEEAYARPVGAIRKLTRIGSSWRTRFQSAVEIRHLGQRWFFVENRQGDSGLWISVFTSEFTVAAPR